jgi:hypothetical protein
MKLFRSFPWGALIWESKTVRPCPKLQRGVNKSENSQAAEELVLCWAAILPSQGGWHPCRPVSDPGFSRGVPGSLLFSACRNKLPGLGSSVLPRTYAPPKVAQGKNWTASRLDAQRLRGGRSVSHLDTEASAAESPPVPVGFGFQWHPQSSPPPSLPVALGVCGRRTPALASPVLTCR